MPPILVILRDSHDRIVYRWEITSPRRQLDPGESVTIAKRHAFRPITTRVYHPGGHRLEIMVNGVVQAGADFNLGASEGLDN